MIIGTNGTLVKERISPGLQLFAKLVGCLRVQMVSLSRNGFYLAFNCMLNWLVVNGFKWYPCRRTLNCMLNWLVVYGYKWYPCRRTDFTWPSIVC